jgi:non-ribosomal peptide synthetase component F
MYMVLLATLHLLLARLTGQDDFVIVSPMSGRMRSETQSLMGVFIGLMPIRLRVARQWSFLELLEHAKTVTLDAQAHQETSFITVDAELRAAGNVGLARLTPVAFNFFNQTPFLEVQTTPEEAPGLTISSLQERAADITVKNDVLFTMREHASGMDGTVVYASDLFDADTISSLVRRYFRLLEQVLAEPEVCVAQIDLSLPSRPLRLDERHIDDMSEEDAQRFLDEIERSGGMRVQP